MTYIAIYKSLVAFSMLVVGINLCVLAVRRPSNEVKFLLCLSFTVLCYLAGYYLFLDGTAPSLIVWGLKLMYLSSLVFILIELRIFEQVFNIRLPRRMWGVISIWLFLLAVIVTIFNHYSRLPPSHWMYRSYTFSYNSSEGRYIMQMDYGWATYAFSATVILFLFSTIALYMYRIQHSRRNHRRNYTMYFFVLLIPNMTFVLTRRFHLEQTTFPYFPLILVIFLSAATILVVMQRFASLSDLAIKKIGDVVESPMFVVDEVLRVHDANKAAVELYPEYKNTAGMMGKPQKANAVLQNIVSPLYETEGDDKQLITIEGNVYSSECHKVITNNTLYGYVIVLHDVTDQRGLYVKMQERNKHLQQLVHYYEDEISIIRGKFVSGLIQIILTLDKNTGEHMRRTSNYTYVIARQLQRMGKFPEILTDQYVEMLSKVAPLHDVGKLNLSKELLAKQDGFTKPQMEEHQRHVTYGVEIIDSLIIANPDDLFYQLSHEIALFHHEWWDGSTNGYPGHFDFANYVIGEPVPQETPLKGEEIPLSARIVALADVFDALSHKRVYKEAWSTEDAFTEIQSLSGKQFDPEIVTAFIQVKERICAINAAWENVAED